MSLDIDFCWRLLPKILVALPTTLLVAAFGMLAGSVAGLTIFLACNRRVPVLSQLLAALVSFFRGTPFLVQLFLVYYGYPVLAALLQSWFGSPVIAAHLRPLSYAFIAFSCNAAAFISEIVRSAVMSVDKGQLEAAHSVGLSSGQAYRRIVLPQAFVVALPGLANFFLALVKGSSLAFTVSVIDVMAVAKIEGADGYRFLEAYLVSSLLYWAVCAAFEGLFLLAERHVGRYRKEASA